MKRLRFSMKKLETTNVGTVGGADELHLQPAGKRVFPSEMIRELNDQVEVTREGLPLVRTCPSTLQRTSVRFRDELTKHKFLRDRDIQTARITTRPTHTTSSRRSIWKNFVTLCMGLMFCFMSFLPLRNLQSSLYSSDHLGNISLFAMYISFVVGSIMSTWISQNVRPKGILLAAVACHILYAGANLYPSFYSLIPTSVIFGFVQAPMWSVQELLLASYGATYTALTGLCIEKAIQQFQSVFVIFCHAAQIFGNLLQSAILQHGNSDDDIRSTQNTSRDSGVNITHHAPDIENWIWLGPFGYRIERRTYSYWKPDCVQILKIVYLALAGIAMTIIAVSFYKPDIIIQRRKLTFRERMFDVFSFFKTKAFFTLGFLMVFTGMQQAVVISDVTRLYGTETMGLGMIGYMMMCYGTCQLATLLVVEKLQKCIRPIVFVLKGLLVTLGLLILLYVWEPGQESVFLILGYAGVWGAVDAIWQSQVQSLLIQASPRKECAALGFRMCQSLGLGIIFLLDIWASVLYKACAVGGVLVMGVISYMIGEVMQNPVPYGDTEPCGV